MASREASASSTKQPSRRPSSASMTASSSDSGSSCSLSTTASAFQRNGGPEDRAKRVPIGARGRQRYLFSGLGNLVDKDAKDRWGRRKLGIRLPQQDTTKLVDPKCMKPEELERTKLGGKVYYCAPKQLLYSKETFKNKKKAKASKNLLTKGSSTPAADRPPAHAYIYHSYSACRCLEGGREVILEVHLSAAFDALLPNGTRDPDDDCLSPEWASDVRIRDLSSVKTRPLDHPLNGYPMSLKRGAKLWYSPEMKQYFTEPIVKHNLKTKAEYEQFLANPPKEHSHH